MYKCGRRDLLLVSYSMCTDIPYRELIRPGIPDSCLNSGSSSFNILHSIGYLQVGRQVQRILAWESLQNIRKEVLNRNLLEKGELTPITMVISADMIETFLRKASERAKKRVRLMAHSFHQ